MLEIDLLAEAQRQFTVCNACRYCEGYCAVFPAMERRTTFTPGDLDYLANLCHDCRGCYQACMYTEPHEFALNVPQLLSAARIQTFRRFVWPHRFIVTFAKPGRSFAIVAAAAALVMLASIEARGVWPFLVQAQLGAGSFYRVVPYLGMVLVAFALSLWALVAWGRSTAAYLAELRASGALPGRGGVVAALWDGVALTYLRGGGGGCYYPDENAPSAARRYLHITLVAGLFLTFVATCAAGVYQEFLGRLPPYPLWSVPVLAGTLGGAGLVIGSAGLLALKPSSAKHLGAAQARRLDVAFLVALLLLGATGLLLLAFRSTSVMGSLLVVHLAFVAAAFATAPYGKLVHAFYRLGALAAFHREESRERGD